jgi:dihydrolipoamide dehydrogenase
MNQQNDRPSSESYDLAIIGGGPGGYVAAIRASQLGLRTALIEKDPLGSGGTCLWRGCIPTKCLLQSAETLDLLRRAGEFGIRAGEPSFDFAAVQKRKDGVVRGLGRGVDGQLKRRRVAVRSGTGRILGPGKIEVRRTDGGELVGTKRIMIATGSAPAAIPVAPFDGKRIISSDDILKLQAVPKSLLILGAGAVGVEFASIFASFGSQVTLIEMLPRILPIEDEDSSAAVAKAFGARGIRIFTGARLLEAKADAAAGAVRARVALADGRTEDLSAELLLVAAGRKPFLKDLGLEAAGIDLEKGTIPVDGWMRTRRDGFWAIGDVVATPQLAHVASAEGILAVEAIAGRERQPLDYGHTPSCTYCHPEVASVGMSERAAQEKGYKVKVGKFPFSHLGRAMILGETEGFVKIVSEERYDEVLGVHIVGPRATDLIGEACALLGLESTAEEIGRIVHPHPTLTEAYFEAAGAVHGQAIHG